MDIQQRHEEAKLKVDALENIVRGLSMLALIESEDGRAVRNMHAYTVDLKSAKNELEQISLEATVPLASA